MFKRKNKINARDIARIAAELMANPDMPAYWVNRENLEHGAIQSVVESAMQAIYERFADDEDVPEVLADAFGNTFMIGWECGREYGLRRSSK